MPREIRRWFGSEAGEGNTLFWVIKNLVNPDRCGDLLNVGGVSGDLVCDFDSRNYPWDFMEEVEGGADISLFNFTNGKILDPGIKFNSGDYLKSKTDTLGDFDLEDIIISCYIHVEWPSVVHSPRIFYKKIGSMSDDSFYFRINSNGDMCIVLLYNGSVIVTDPIGVTNNSLNFIYAYVDRDGYMRLMMNGVYSGKVDISSLQLVQFSDGVACLGLSHSNESISRFRIWKGSGLVVSESDIDRVLYRRYFVDSGIWPLIATGTYAPTVFSRACGAYAQIMHTSDESEFQFRLHMMGNDFLRMSYCYYWGNNGYYMPESQRTNRCIYSEDMTQWTPTRMSIASNADAAPDGRQISDGLIASSDDDSHYITIVPTLVSPSDYVISAYIKPGNKSWAKIYVESPGEPGVIIYAYFDVLNGIVGTKSSGAIAHIDGPHYDGYYRCLLHIIATGSESVSLYVCDDDASDGFQGDGETISAYAWGVQFEEGAWQSSQIPTNGAIATRLADRLTYKGDDGNIPSSGHGRMIFDFVWPYWDYHYYYFSLSPRTLVALSDGGSSNDCLMVYVYYSSGELKLHAKIVANSVPYEITYNGALLDFERHTVGVKWDVANEFFELDVDGNIQSISISDFPDDLDRIELGHIDGASIGAGLLVGNLKIMKWEAPAS
jgi:hypothetical protein